MSKKNMVVVIAIVTFILLMVLAIQGRAKFPVFNRVFVGTITTVNTSVLSIAGGVNSVQDFIQAAIFMKKENAQLKDELASLQYSNIKMADIWAENERLRSLLAYKNSHTNYEMSTFKVVGRNMGEFKDSILINGGANQSLLSGMAVVNASGIIGVVDVVYSDVSKVRLLTSPLCKVGGIVLRANSRVVGVVNGVAGTDADLVMNNMSREADVIEGDVIVTSGLGGRTPSGLLVGNVVKLDIDGGGLLKAAVIKPVVDFNRLEEVMVITNYTNYTGLVDDTKKQRGGTVK